MVWRRDGARGKPERPESCYARPGPSCCRGGVRAYNPQPEGVSSAIRDSIVAARQNASTMARWHFKEAERHLVWSAWTPSAWSAPRPWWRSRRLDRPATCYSFGDEPADLEAAQAVLPARQHDNKTPRSRVTKAARQQDATTSGHHGSMPARRNVGTMAGWHVRKPPGPSCRISRARHQAVPPSCWHDARMARCRPTRPHWQTGRGAPAGAPTEAGPYAH
jgi:hypothetical protein